MGRGVWGIDVSKSSVKAVKLEGGVLTQVGVIPYESAGTGDAGDLDAQIKAALAELKSKYRVGADPVVFSLPSHSTFNRLIKLPPVEDSKIPETVRYEAQSQIPFQIDEVIWDHQLVEREYNPGEEKEVILFAIKRDIVEQFLGNIADLQFNVEAVQFAPVAIFNFLLKDQAVEGPSVALDMGGDNTDLIVIDGKKFWVRNLPITGNDVTKALQKAFNIPFEEAEKLKLKAGQSQQAQKIFNAIQPVLRDLVNEINRSMGYYKSISKTSKFDQVLLMGNSTKVLNFQKFLGQSLQLPAHRVEKLARLRAGGAVNADELDENLGSLGTAIGLALQGAGPVVNRVNLLPEQFRKKKELGRKKPFWVAAAACLYLMVGLAWMKADGELSEFRGAHASASRVKTDAEGVAKALEEASKVDEIEANLKPLTTLAFERDLMLKVMDQINPNIPANGDPATKPDERIWVVDWKFEERDRTPPAAPTPGKEPVHLLPAAKVLVSTLEVVITKRANGDLARNFIIRNLLNYNPGAKAPAAAGKPCVIRNEHWELSEGQGTTGLWRLEEDANDLVWPVPKGFAAKPADSDPPPPKNYWRYRVTLEIPVGAEARKAAPAPAGAEKK
jgi:type IV pilus assembly protein PilM